ncbi:MAG: enoyl-CoA hydratase/isomerase family protein, partial [Bacteroidia bacterium]|nr:enoyl-CoA hydratase/isomerase family protein [Bacteroidia bacterium]
MSEISANSGASGAGTEIKTEVVVERHGNAGLITLNRPKALNALSLQMIRDLSTALIAWRD